MQFFDCNVSYGVDAASPPLKPVQTARELQAAMARAGVARAIVYRAEQLAASVQWGHRLLAEDLADCPNLHGLWTIVPEDSDEMPPLQQARKRMQAERIVGFRLCPGPLRYVPRSFALRGWLKLAREHRIPLFVNTDDGFDLPALADLLQTDEGLTVVLTHPDVWPNDRLLRPFVRRFPNVYLDLSHVITAGGIESFVSRFGAERLLYGSHFPRGYFGAGMQQIRQAGVRDDQKEAIAGGNLQSILEGLDHD